MPSGGSERECVYVCVCMHCMHAHLCGGWGRQRRSKGCEGDREKETLNRFYIYMHTQKCSHTHTRRRRQTLQNIHTYTYHLRTHTHTLTIHTHTQIQIHLLMHACMHTLITCMHTHIHSPRTLTYTYAHHAHTHTHTLTTHAHTHTQYMYSCTHASIPVYVHTKHVLLQTNIHIYGSEWLNGFVYMNIRISTYSHTPDSEK